MRTWKKYRNISYLDAALYEHFKFFKENIKKVSMRKAFRMEETFEAVEPALT